MMCTKFFSLRNRDDTTQKCGAKTAHAVVSIAQYTASRDRSAPALRILAGAVGNAPTPNALAPQTCFRDT